MLKLNVWLEPLPELGETGFNWKVGDSVETLANKTFAVAGAIVTLETLLPHRSV